MHWCLVYTGIIGNFKQRHMTTIINLRAFVGILVLAFLSCGQTTLPSQVNRPNNHTQADPCDNPDADIHCCFVNMPSSLTSTMTIAPADEPGDKLVISGTIYKADGKTPYPNVILYAYHTDRKGYYSKKGTETGIQKWHGHLHGWCNTDRNGFYKIQTIRPARYPNNTIPAHIHAAIQTDKGEVMWINDYVFKDDSLVDEKYVSSLTHVGGSGIVEVHKTSENSWTGKRDIILGNK